MHSIISQNSLHAICYHRTISNVSTFYHYPCKPANFFEECFLAYLYQSIVGSLTNTSKSDRSVGRISRRADMALTMGILRAAGGLSGANTSRICGETRNGINSGTGSS